jgi:hypothetical protein
LFQDLSPGDDVYIENRKFLAFCHYDRHQASNDFAEQNHARVDGLAVYPQRPEFNVAEALHGRYRYSFAGKMIAIMNTLDRGAWPCGGVRYHERAKRAFGDRLDTHFRLWWNDNASHMPPSWGPPRMTTRTVDYIGSVHQAVFDVIDWVEYAKEPPATTSYRYSDDSKLTLASAAADRHGIQPVVTLTANGAGRADVSVGEVVTLEAIAEVPGGTGKIVSVEWDFDGEGAWPEQDGSVDGTTDTTRTTRSHRYDTRGTYFPVVRVHAHRSGDVDATLGRVANLARARVVVS